MPPRPLRARSLSAAPGSSSRRRDGLTSPPQAERHGGALCNKKMIFGSVSHLTARCCPTHLQLAGQAADHRVGEVAGGGLAAEVARADVVVAQGPVDGAA